MIEKICSLYGLFKRLAKICVVLLVLLIAISLGLDLRGQILGIIKIIMIISLFIVIISVIGCQIYASIKKEKLPTFISFLEIAIIIGIIIGGLSLYSSNSVVTKDDITEEDIIRARQELMTKNY